jgi:hypothetical protein
LLGPGAQSGADGVEDDVVEDGGEVLVGVHRLRPEAIAEQMAAALVPAVEAKRVGSVEAVHPAREVFHRRGDDEVVVRGHQAVRVDIPAESLDGVGEERQERAAVEPVAEDRRVVDAERGDVEGAVRQDAAQSARHAANVRRRLPARHRANAVVTLLFRTPCPFPTPRRV